MEVERAEPSGLHWSCGHNQRNSENSMENSRQTEVFRAGMVQQSLDKKDEGGRNSGGEADRKV